MSMDNHAAGRDKRLVSKVCLTFVKSGGSP